MNTNFIPFVTHINIIFICILYLLYFYFLGHIGAHAGYVFLHLHVHWRQLENRRIINGYKLFKYRFRKRFPWLSEPGVPTIIASLAWLSEPGIPTIIASLAWFSEPGVHIIMASLA